MVSFDDAGSADLIKDGIEIIIPAGLRKRRFSFAVLIRNLDWAEFVPDGAADRKSLPFRAEFRRDGKTVDSYRFKVRDQSDSAILPGSDFSCADCAIPGVTMTGSENEEASGSVERWLGAARDVSPGAVCIPIRCEYADGTTDGLRELRELNLNLWDAMLDADKFVLEPEFMLSPNALSGLAGSIIMAIVCLTDP